MPRQGVAFARLRHQKRGILDRGVALARLGGPRTANPRQGYRFRWHGLSEEQRILDRGVVFVRLWDPKTTNPRQGYRFRVIPMVGPRGFTFPV
jgi:hypothetical protein